MTVTDAEQLNGLSSEVLEQVAQKFIMVPAEERRTMGMTACPPHVRKNWLLGCARRVRAEARKQSVATVTEALWRHHGLSLPRRRTLGDTAAPRT